MNLTIIQQFAT